MSKVTQITYDNFKKYLGKRVEVSITCYAAGIMHPDENILVGMNPDTYYFVSDKDTEDELYWHWTIEKNQDDKNSAHIDVWDKEGYDEFYKLN